LIALDFDAQYQYDAALSGIVVPVEIVTPRERVGLAARLDTGASDCLFDRSHGERIGLDIESGYRREYRTRRGSFTASGREIALNTQGLEWTAMVFFYTAADPDDNFLGRRGWLDRARLGLVHYDRRLLLSRYDK